MTIKIWEGYEYWYPSSMIICGNKSSGGSLHVWTSPQIDTMLLLNWCIASFNIPPGQPSTAPSSGHAPQDIVPDPASNTRPSDASVWRHRVRSPTIGERLVPISGQISYSNYSPPTQKELYSRIKGKEYTIKLMLSLMYYSHEHTSNQSTTFLFLGT